MTGHFAADGPTIGRVKRDGLRLNEPDPRLLAA
jgi:hypothetical protein